MTDLLIERLKGIVGEEYIRQNENMGKQRFMLCPVL